MRGLEKKLCYVDERCLKVTFSIRKPEKQTIRLLENTPVLRARL